jgi:hypothetical protein
MATKKSKGKFAKMDYSLCSLNFCCGIGEVGSFREEEDHRDWGDWRNHRPKMIIAEKLFATKEEQAQACYDDIVKRTGSGDNFGDDFFSQLLITLVSSYGSDQGSHKKDSHQWPEMEDILLREGWTIWSVFINPNHGNEVTVYGKYFPDRIKHPDDEDNDDDGDGDDYDDDE